MGLGWEYAGRYSPLDIPSSLLICGQGYGQEGQQGLKMSQWETVTIAKVVNEEWYHGYKDKHTLGYFPRNFVSIQRSVIFPQAKLYPSVNNYIMRTASQKRDSKKVLVLMHHRKVFHIIRVSPGTV